MLSRIFVCPSADFRAFLFSIEFFTATVGKY
jgi:hypothetical protein